MDRDVPAAHAALLDFSATPLTEILAHLQARLVAGEPGPFHFLVADPDLGRGRYAGEPIGHDGHGRRALHRPWRTWIDLADRLELRLLTPRPHSHPSSAEPRGRLLVLGFERLADRSWDDEPSAPDASAASAEPAPSDLSADRTERYGAASGYARIAKGEEPGFVVDLAEALERCRLPSSARVLDLGVNDGDELALMMELSAPLRSARFVGVDHSASALAAARARFSEEQVQLICADLGALDGHALGRFDLVVCLGTLQSPGVDDRALLRRIVQEHLTPGGAVLLGVPNCRYRDGELLHGARMRNFRQPEFGLVVKDLAFYRKYLQQHDRQVFLTGNHTLLLTAVAR